MNRELISDLPRFRRTEAGYFAAPVPALASATASTEQTNVRDRKTASAQRTLTGRMEVQDASGIVWESARQTATKGESSTSHSRGERSNSDFAGGGTSGQGLGRTDAHSSEGKAKSGCASNAGWVARGLQAVASNSIQGKGRWT